MSRRYPSSYHRDGGVNKPYQPTTVPIHRYTPDTGLSDDTFTDSQIYEYYEDVNGYIPPASSYHYQHPHSSGGSGSIRIPATTTFDDNNRQQTYHLNRPKSVSKKYKVYPSIDKRIYRNSSDRLYQEIPLTQQQQQQQQLYHHPTVKLVTTATTTTITTGTERPQSSLSSGVTSAIVDGCGGKCQTFENVCYFFLQLVFMMGILIGISLSIAGLVLRKSAARNLQVLVYIGVLLAIVSSVLLGIQWNARNNTKKRKLAITKAKRAPIQMEILNVRQQQQQQQHQHQQQPLMMEMQHQIQTPLQQPLPQHVVEQPGIPWWRRRDLV